jgi:succinoglycan biosynthesis protein ExoA
MSWYRPRSSFPALFQQYRQYGYWKVRVIRKHKLPASIRHLVPGAFLLLLSALVVVAGVALLAGEILPSIDPYQSSKAAATFISRFSLMTLASIAGLYATLVAAASVITAASSRWRFLPALPFAFACYHFGYGLGFLEGLADFVLLKRSPRLTQVSITRSS